MSDRCGTCGIRIRDGVCQCPEVMEARIEVAVWMRRAVEIELGMTF